MSKCIIPVLGKRIRATVLDECGTPPEPAAECAYVATNGFISLTLSAEVEDGAEIITRRADGSLCVNERNDDSFKRFSFEAEFCGVIPDLLALVSNASTYMDYADVRAGITVAEGTISKRFALELWTGLSGAVCVPGAETASGYLVLPFLSAGVLSDITVDGENAVTFGITGSFTRGGNNWGVGPYDVLLDTTASPDPTPAPLPTALDPFDHLLLIDTGLAPPPSECACQPMPAAA
jgi:hypothetical protein